jgi:hypothetical protein
MLPRILSTLADKPPKERLGPRCLDYLRAHGVPPPLVGTLDECAYAGAIRIGRLWLSPLVEIDLENQEEENAPCMEHGLLIVGSGLNGDPIGLEISSGRMAFVSHDLLWERDYGDFEECVVRSPLGFHEFWSAAVDDPGFPVDSYDAASVWREG